MNARKSRNLTIATVFVAAVVFMGASATAMAQGIWETPPPPEGPAQATPNAPHSIMTAFYTDVVALVMQQAVAKANTKLSLAKVSVSADMSSPYMLATGYRDRPNQFYANIPYNLTYTVNILSGVGPTLTITQSSNIQVSCEGWQTGSGLITSKIVFDPAYFDPEQYNNLITSQLQSQIQAAMNLLPLGPASLPIPLTPQHCRTLGAYSKAQSGFDDSIYWDDPLPFHFHPPVITPGIAVRVLQVRRLPLEYGGIPEYQPVEGPYLELWADYSFTSLSLPPMMEGQIFVPTTNSAVTLPVPLNGQLVLIVNMQYQGLQLPIGQSDSVYAVFDSTTNFGSGTQALDTPKTYSYRVPTLFGKPIIVSTTGAGYEVTLQISGPASVFHP
jgi:hypothetical protein